MIPGNKTVLVLTDQQEQFISIETFFVEHGFQVLQTKSFREAMQMLRDNYVCLMLVRIETLGNELADCLQRIKRSQPDIGLILLTPETGKYPLIKALDAGADGAISVPVNNRVLSLLLQRPYWEALNRQDWWRDVCGANN